MAASSGFTFIEMPLREKYLSWWEKLVLNALLSPINLNMLIIQFLLMCLFSLLVEFSAAF